jgi:hypothetical protein
MYSTVVGLGQGERYVGERKPVALATAELSDIF